MANKTFNTRVKNKRDTAANWEAVATTFQPLDGELIIVDTSAGKTRFKVGRYDTAKGRLLYYNEIPFADEYLYNDLNESQGKIYDKLKGIDDKSIIESTLEPIAGADDKLYVYNIGLWQFPKTGFYKIKLAKVGALGVLLKLYARITKDDGTTPDDWDNNNLKAMGNAGGYGLIEEIYAQVDYINDDKFTVYRVQFFNCFGYLGSFWVNTYYKTTQKWEYVYKHRVTADRVSNNLTLTKGDVTTKFNGSVAREVSIPTKTSELTNDSFVSYAEQILTEDQQNQAKTNLGIDVLTGNTTTVTPTQVKEAILAGRPIAITYTDTTYGNLTFTSFGYSLENNVVVANLVATSNGQYILADLTGMSNTNGWTLQTTELGTSTDIANNYVKYSESQTLTDDQKQVARNNIGAASASTIETMQAAIDSKPSAADAVYTATAASTDGVAYTATVSGIDSLTVGASFIMIPNKASTSKAPTLNVNGLGAKPIRRRLSSLTTSLQQGYSTNWIALNKPFTVVYDGTAWVIEGLTKTDGADVYGAVAQATADAKGNNIADTYATIAMLQSLLPKVTTITLTSNWVGDASPYYQDIALSCVTETSIVDLQPTPEQLNSWQDDGIAFTTLSGNGTVRVYVAGGKPSSAISVQVRVQEVTVI